MGRGKIEIKRIENSSNRQVTYSKRRNGLIKKAKEITVLCDAKVSLVIIGSSGKIHEYCSPSTTLPDILERYHKLAGKKLWDAKHEDSETLSMMLHPSTDQNLSNEIDRIKKENDNMQIELRHLKGEDITSLHYKELMALEDALENGLVGVREKQMEIYKMMRKNDRILEEEHKELNFVLQQREMAMERREMEHNGYHQQLQDFEPLMPFTFRIQPMHPNLQERM